MNCRPRPKALSIAIALACGAGPEGWVHAQEPPALPEPIRIEVTGSRIARTDGETALPVQVIERDEILRGNWTTASELMAHVSANFNGMNSQLSIGITGNQGQTSANLRGLGEGNTLVLLNGRRLSNYAFLDTTVDLNTIPLAAIERVEILKDGASSIYGTDAIAGVVNFITRKDFSGVELTGQVGVTQHGGGDHAQATITAGWGDLSKDRFNAFLTIDWQKDTALAARDRPFSATGYRPDAGLDKTSQMTLPANILVGSERLLNPVYASGCTPPVSIPHAPTYCAFDYASVSGIFPPTEQWTAIGRATWQLAPGQQLFAEYVYARNRIELSIAPTPAARYTNIDFTPILYPENGPYYPTGFAAANGLSGPLEVFYRTLPLGPRVEEVTTEAQRLVVGAQGTVSDWTYGAGYTHSANQVDDTFTSGWVSVSRFIPAMYTGLINPFGESSQAGLDLLASTQISGKARTARGTMDQFDVQFSREFGNLPGGPLAVALGSEWRREKLTDLPAPVLGTGDIMGNNFEVSPQDASRNVGAGFVEFNIPLVKTVELGVSARYDNYSDFGGTTNPKIAVRWQPTRLLLFRGSWGTGYRAPTLPDLHIQQSGSMVGGLEDPLRCPVTMSKLDCGFGEYQVIGGGNANLQPETSTQYTAGALWEPASGVSFGVEWWKIDKTNVIGSFGPDLILDRYDIYGSSHVVRGPVDPLYPALPGAIQTIIGYLENIGNLSTSGFDVSIKARGPVTALGRFQFMLDGTYIQTFTQHLSGLPAESVVGRSGEFGPVPRWRHYASLNWQDGPWSATLGQLYQSGYVDANPDPEVSPRRVGTYSLWDLQGVYTGFRSTSIAFGIRNLFDTDPPFTNQSGTFQVGYDPSYADPRGRTFYVRITYAFM